MNELALYALIDEWVSKPFRWGEHDCVLFACACLDAAFGMDLYTRWVGKWSDAASAAAAARESSLHAELVRLGFERVDVEYAQTGDVCLTADGVIDGLPSPAICLGRNLAGMTLDGLVIGRIEDQEIMEVWSCRRR